MTGRDIFKIWAPVGAKWVDWVRPVPFVAINEGLQAYELNEFIIPKINFINELNEKTAIIIDLPGCDSIKEGLAVAKLGYRPIPIYNGTIEQVGALPTVNNQDIEIGLIKGAVELKKIEISNDAPPAFLTDTNRMHRLKMNPSVFDNSWDVYPQDIPSAECFLQNGIKKIIVRSESISLDLKKILYKFQKLGIKILFSSGYDEPKEVKLKKPRQDKND